MKYVFYLLALCRDLILTNWSIGPSVTVSTTRLCLTSNPLLSPFVPLRRVMQLRLLFEWTIKRPRGAPPIIQFLFNRLLCSCLRTRARSSQFPWSLLSLENHLEREKETRRGSGHRRIKREWANTSIYGRDGDQGADPRLLSLSRLTK